MNITILYPQAYCKNDIPFCIHKYRYDIVEEINLHSHEFIEIAYVIQGQGVHIIDGKVYPVSPGDLYIINMDTAHTFFPMYQPDTEPLEVYNCIFSPKLLDSLDIDSYTLENIISCLLEKKFYHHSFINTPFLYTSKSYNEDIIILLNNLYEEYNSFYFYRCYGVKKLFSQLLLTLYSFSDTESVPKFLTHSCEAITPYQVQIVSDAIQYLKNNYNSRLSLQEIANHVHLSKTYFGSLFKKITGITIMNYLEKLRIHKACELLLEKDYRILDIVNLIGFTDYRFFNSAFKRTIHLTPHEYRKKYKYSS